MLMKNVLRSIVPARGSYKLEMQVGYATSSGREEDTQGAYSVVRVAAHCSVSRSIPHLLGGQAAYDIEHSEESAILQVLKGTWQRNQDPTKLTEQVIWEPNPGQVSGAR